MAPQTMAPENRRFFRLTLPAVSMATYQTTRESSPHIRGTIDFLRFVPLLRPCSLLRISRPAPVPVSNHDLEKQGEPAGNRRRDRSKRAPSLGGEVLLLLHSYRAAVSAVAKMVEWKDERVFG